MLFYVDKFIFVLLTVKNV